MSNSPYSNDALEKYSKLIEATVSGNLEAVKELLKDESIDIQTLIPAEDDTVTSAVALAIDSGNEEMIQAFFNSPQMDFSRSIGQFKVKNRQLCYFKDSSSESYWQYFNVVNYLLLKKNFKLAERLIKEGKCTWNGDNIALATYFYLKKKKSKKLMKLIIIPNVETIRNLSKDDKKRLVSLFHRYKANLDEIFDICFPSIEEGYDDYEFWKWFYTFNISEEWFEKLKQKDMLKNLNVLSDSGKSIIMHVAEKSLKKAKILYDFGADIRLNGNVNWFFTDPNVKRVGKFVKLFPFTEEDFKKFLKLTSCYDKLTSVQKILRVYPHYERLLTLENVVSAGLEESNDVSLDICLIYREELGLKGDSILWLEILARNGRHKSNYGYLYLKEYIRCLGYFCGREFKQMLESNKAKLLHLLVENGRTSIAWHFAQDNVIDWNVLDETGNSAFVKLLLNPQDGRYDLVDKFDASLISALTETEIMKILHHPKLTISSFSLELIDRICQVHKINMFAPNPSTGESLLDQTLKFNNLIGYAWIDFLKRLEHFKKVMSESQARLLYANCQKLWFDILEKFPTVLPSNVWELRDEVSNELLVERVIKSGEIPHGSFIIKNEQRFFPHLELIAEVEKRKSGYKSFWHVMQSTNSEAYLNLLKKDSIRSQYSDEIILKYALKSDTVRLLQFAIEELGILPNTLTFGKFPLGRLTSYYNTEMKFEKFDFLVQKGAIACIKPIKCAYTGLSDAEWIEKLAETGYELSPESIQNIKKRLSKYAESDPETSLLAKVDCEIVINPRFTHHFDVRDKSICLLEIIYTNRCYIRYLQAGADPRCVITSDGKSPLHLLPKEDYYNPKFYYDFGVTEQDFRSKGQASYSPIERMYLLYSNDMIRCPLMPIYPRLFGFKVSKRMPYIQAVRKSYLGYCQTCIICREVFKFDDELVVGICKHVLHWECYEQLPEKKCPICGI